MIEMMFEIEDSGKYLGLSDGRTWNGWQCPLFTFEVAQQIAKDFSVYDDKLIYDEANDTFIYKTDDYPDDESDTFEAIMIDGKKFYAIGAGSWCWDGEPVQS